MQATATTFSFPACARDATDDYSLQAVSTVCNIVCANLLFRFGNSLIFRSWRQWTRHLAASPLEVGACQKPQLADFVPAAYWLSG